MNHNDYLSEEPFFNGLEANLVLVEFSGREQKILYVNNQILNTSTMEEKIEDAINAYFDKNENATKARLCRVNQIKEYKP